MCKIVAEETSKEIALRICINISKEITTAFSKELAKSILKKKKYRKIGEGSAKAIWEFHEFAKEFSKKLPKEFWKKV